MGEFETVKGDIKQDLPCCTWRGRKTDGNVARLEKAAFTQQGNRELHDIYCGDIIIEFRN